MVPQQERETLELAAFVLTWTRIARACERGLSDPSYPADRRRVLYEMLGAARDCAEPAGLQRVRALAHQRASR